MYFSFFVNSPCEQRQGLAVLSSTTPWLSSKNRANHHDGHTKEGKNDKKKKNQTLTASSHCLILTHSTTCTQTPLQAPCTSKTQLVMLHMGLNVGGRKKEEEGGATGLILQPLDDDLRSGCGIELRPPHPRPRNGKN